jgi:hypothetical protein
MTAHMGGWASLNIYRRFTEYRLMALQEKRQSIRSERSLHDTGSP